MTGGFFERPYPCSRSPQAPCGPTGVEVCALNGRTANVTIKNAIMTVGEILLHIKKLHHKLEPQNRNLIIAASTRCKTAAKRWETQHEPSLFRAAETIITVPKRN